MGKACKLGGNAGRHGQYQNPRGSSTLLSFSQHLSSEPSIRNNNTTEAGHLYLVATPIGNLGDITARSLETLKSCDLVACEDTRVTGKLLKHFGIQKPCISYREANERTLAEELTQKLKAGASIALLSDAGTPNLSDPGFRIVRACRKKDLSVIPLPGPCAAIAALSASGLPTHQFFFAGFLAPKRAARLRFFEAEREATHTVILYESCHRIEKCMDDLIEILGSERIICLAREITKLYETFWTGTAADIREKMSGKKARGEYVLMIAPASFTL